MRELNIRNITMMAVAASCLVQVGAQLFALSVVASTLSAAPPRSLAILHGEFRYDSSAFWSTVPPITFTLFVVALVANWRTARRRLLLLALTLFVMAGLAAGIVLEPMFEEVKRAGFRDVVDPVLQSQAASWHAADWMVWAISATSAVSLLLALIRPTVSIDKLTE